MGGNALGTTPTTNGRDCSTFAETFVRAFTKTQKRNAAQNNVALRRRRGVSVVTSVLSETISNSLKKRRNTRLFSSGLPVSQIQVPRPTKDHETALSSSRYSAAVSIYKAKSNAVIIATLTTIFSKNHH
jgi:hypothetical protein